MGFVRYFYYLCKDIDVSTALDMTEQDTINGIELKQLKLKQI